MTLPESNPSSRYLTDEQPQLFDPGPPSWREYWEDDLPEFIQGDTRPYDAITVYFANPEDKHAFLELVEAPGARSRGFWFPYRKKRRYSTGGEIAKVRLGRYPIYVISKGRADTRLTARALERLGIEYRIAVESDEYDKYGAVIDERRILTLPFSNLGEGSIPARNFVWEHAKTLGHRRHWILDDNIRNFARLNRNENRIVLDENPFIPIEDFVDRCTNIGLAGMQYRGFASDKNPAMPPYRLNTRIYSCILVDNELPFRWRGRYNEDTDLSLRVLKSGLCTVLFNTYLIDKAATMSMPGGNTDELYAGDGRRQMAESLREQHPDVVGITTKWGRVQHQVDYRRFRQRLELREQMIL